jgi:hypothetical protein
VAGATLYADEPNAAANEDAGALWLYESKSSEFDAIA